MKTLVPLLTLFSVGLVGCGGTDQSDFFPEGCTVPALGASWQPVAKYKSGTCPQLRAETRFVASVEDFVLERDCFFEHIGMSTGLCMTTAVARCLSGSEWHLEYRWVSESQFAVEGRVIGCGDPSCEAVYEQVWLKR